MMEVGMIVIFVPALLFFAGILYLLVKGRGKEKSQAAENSLLWPHRGMPEKKKRQG